MYCDQRGVARKDTLIHLETFLGLKSPVLNFLNCLSSRVLLLLQTTSLVIKKLVLLLVAHVIANFRYSFCLIVEGVELTGGVDIFLDFNKVEGW